MLISLEFFLILLFVVAFLYSSVGHGGASGYLALMAIAGISPSIMKSSALILNLFVAGVAFSSFYRAGHFKLKVLWPFAVASMPMAFVGAHLFINPTLYKIILGICLLISVAWMILKPQLKDRPIKEPSLAIALIVGAILGFVSGIIGIGGGILLSPLLIFLNWSTIKQTAGISAAFIVLNSFSGLAGLVQNGLSFDRYSMLWILAAFAGGLSGSYVGSRKLSVKWLRYILAVVLFSAAIKLFTF
jgi:uncharacterized membrane protein YfcA